MCWLLCLPSHLLVSFHHRPLFSRQSLVLSQTLVDSTPLLSLTNTGFFSGVKTLYRYELFLFRYVKQVSWAINDIVFLIPWCCNRWLEMSHFLTLGKFEIYLFVQHHGCSPVSSRGLTCFNLAAFQVFSNKFPNFEVNLSQPDRCLAWSNIWLIIAVSVWKSGTGLHRLHHQKWNSLFRNNLLWTVYLFVNINYSFHNTPFSVM